MQKISDYCFIFSLVLRIIYCMNDLKCKNKMIFILREAQRIQLGPNFLNLCTNAKVIKYTKSFVTLRRFIQGQFVWILPWICAPWKSARILIFDFCIICHLLSCNLRLFPFFSLFYTCCWYIKSCNLLLSIRTNEFFNWII